MAEDLTGSAGLEKSNVPCMGCGALCDDLHFRETMQGPQLQESGCVQAHAWLARAQAQLATDEITWCWVDDDPAMLEHALLQSGELLTQSRRPLVLLGGGLTAETYQQALEIALDIHAVVCLDDVDGTLAFSRAADQVGQVSGTWGEVRSRCDTVVFWQADVLADQGDSAWPCFAKRLGLADLQQPRPKGRQDRTLWSISSTLNPTSQKCDYSLTLRHDGDLAGLMTLRAVLADRWIDEHAVLMQTGVAMDDWKRLAQALKDATSAAMLIRLPAPNLPTDRQVVAEQASRLSQELNNHANFYLVPLTGTIPQNLGGALAMMGATLGVTDAVDLSLDLSRVGPEPDFYSLDALMARDEVDSVLMVGDFADRFSHDDFWRFVQSRPSILLTEHVLAGPPRPKIALTHAPVGLVEAGTVFRSDDIPISLKHVYSSDRPTARTILSQLREHTQRLSATPEDSNP